MNLIEAKEFISNYTKEFAKKEFKRDVTVEFSKTSVRRWGVCYPSQNKIRYSNNFVLANSNNIEALKALAKHECCHLKESGHGKAFAMLCNKYGIKATHTDKAVKVNKPEPKKYYLYECISCGMKIKQLKRVYKESACKICCDKYNNGKFGKEYLFKFKEAIF